MHQVLKNWRRTANTRKRKTNSTLYVFQRCKSGPSTDQALKEDEEELDRRKRAEEDQHVQVLKSDEAPLDGSHTTQADAATPLLNIADFGGAAAKYWQSLWPDDDDDASFFPHIDLESVELGEAEEDVIRL